MRTITFIFALLALASVALCSVSSTVNWANSYCNRNPEWLCAEFTARSLAAGGFISLDPLASTNLYGSFHGYNLRMVQGLHGYLRSIGWREVSNVPSSIKAGYAIFGNAGGGSWSHACIGVAEGKIDCHNNAHCGTAAQYIFRSANSILAPPSSSPSPPPPAPNPPRGSTKCVNTAVLNVRSCAGTSCSVVGTLSRGRSVTMLGPQENVGGLNWSQVSLSDRTGWVASRYLATCTASHLASEAAAPAEDANATPADETTPDVLPDADDTNAADTTNSTDAAVTNSTSSNAPMPTTEAQTPSETSTNSTTETATETPAATSTHSTTETETGAETETETENEDDTNTAPTFDDGLDTSGNYAPFDPSFDTNTYADPNGNNPTPIAGTSDPTEEYFDVDDVPRPSDSEDETDDLMEEDFDPAGIPRPSDSEDETDDLMEEDFDPADIPRPYDPEADTETGTDDTETGPYDDTETGPYDDTETGPFADPPAFHAVSSSESKKSSGNPPAWVVVVCLIVGVLVGAAVVIGIIAFLVWRTRRSLDVEASKLMVG